MGIQVSCSTLLSSLSWGGGGVLHPEVNHLPYPILREDHSKAQALQSGGRHAWPFWSPLKSSCRAGQGDRREEGGACFAPSDHGFDLWHNTGSL